MALKRVDVLLCERGLCASREQAQASILAGEVWSLQTRMEKAGTKVDEDLPLEVRARALAYVSRAGYKIAHALDLFKISVENRTCLDIGASTGGFTDCLLQRGAGRVFAVDVGYGQLDSKLRRDDRVTVLERINARFLTLDELTAAHPAAADISFICMDVSFISLAKVIQPLSLQLAKTREKTHDWVLLFKPQFEVGREHIGKGGLVKDEGATAHALAEFEAFMQSLKFRRVGGPDSSPIAGKKSGNLELLLHYEKLID